MAVILLTVILVFVTAFAWWKSSRNKSIHKYLQPDAPKNKIILHQFGPAPYVPSISPFVIKLETYLRVTKVPYENRFDRRPGPKGKLPWLQYNNDVIADSQHCMEFVNKTFQVDINNKLTSQQQAIGHVIRRMVEEWMYWILIMWRLIFEPNAILYRTLGLPRLLVWYVKRTSSSRVLSQGIGLHSQQEVVDMMKHDLHALQEILGDKQFLFGDKLCDVTEYDCAVFGQLCQLIWQTPGCGVQEMIQEQYPRLLAFCLRMKNAFWPDWTERLQKSATPKLKQSQEKSSAITTNLATKSMTSMNNIVKSGHNGSAGDETVIASSAHRNFNNNLQ